MNNIENRGQIFKNSEELSNLLALVSLQLQAGQPILLEQKWSMDEKTIFVQMLQETLFISGQERIVKWCSDPITAHFRDLDIIFKEPEESIVGSESAEWLKYRIISETNNTVFSNEKTYIGEFAKILTGSATWQEVLQGLSKLTERERSIIMSLTNDYKEQRGRRVTELKADRERRREYVKSQLVFSKDKVLQEFVDWIYPQFSENPPETVLLPDTYSKAYQNGEQAIIDLLGNTKATREGRFLLTFLNRNAGRIDSFVSYNRVESVVFNSLIANFIKATSKGIEVNTKGLTLSIDISNAFEEVLRRRNMDVDNIFKEVFGKSDVISAFQSEISNKQKNTSFTEGNPLYKKKTFGGYELTSWAKQLIEKHFSGATSSDQINYLTRWREFLQDYIELQNTQRK